MGKYKIIAVTEEPTTSSPFKSQLLPPYESIAGTQTPTQKAVSVDLGFKTPTTTQPAALEPPKTPIPQRVKYWTRKRDSLGSTEKPPKKKPRHDESPVKKVPGKPLLSMGHAPSPPNSPRRIKLTSFLGGISPYVIPPSPLQQIKTIGSGGFATVTSCQSRSVRHLAVKQGEPLPNGRHTLDSEILLAKKLFPTGGPLPRNLFPAKISTTDMLADFKGRPEPILISKQAAVGSFGNPETKRMFNFLDLYIARMNFVKNKTLSEDALSTRMMAMKAFIFELITYQMINGLLELKAKADDGESVQVVHSDLKPDNVLLHKDWAVGLIDFGLCKYVGDKGDHMLGTPPYMAPELLKTMLTKGKVTLTEKQDVWGVAATVYEILSGCSFYETKVWKSTYAPNISYPADNYWGNFKQYLNHYLHKYTPKFQAALYDLEKDTPMGFSHVLLADMFHLEPEKRPGLQEIKNRLLTDMASLKTTYNITSEETDALFQDMFKLLLNKNR
ncbi:protein kinase [bacterium]|jgi:serine/threonine protein kinase|nr:protein kinase [bacterium]MBT3581787.1 protein kinase [bacterium]MBT4552477.1 protein kinase [bacterium]MBT5988223.1 protein kinase [bacterium]MBT7087503.1 protein kinase [bacterium]